MSQPKISNPLRNGLLFMLKSYQKWVSPAFPRRCRYYPTCSAYAVEAVTTHGAFKGIILATWRVLRCNPWSNGGVDHIPEKGKWKRPEWIPPDDWPGHDIPDRSGSRWSRKRFLDEAEQ